MTARLLALCLALLCSGAAADDLARRQEQLLAAQLAEVQKSRAGVAELYLLAAGLNSKQDVFRNDVETMRDLFDRHWNTAKRSVALVADADTRDRYAYPTRANLRSAAQGLRGRIDPDKDVLLLFLTSHGSSDGLNALLPDGTSFKFTAVDVRRLLEETGARHRVVVLSACHSGALIEGIKDERTLVLAAAHGSRSSFGCNFRNMHTWFTEALFTALKDEPSFERAFQAAARSIRQREQDGEATEHSDPQIEVGREIRPRLAQVEARARKAPQWQPPVTKTEAGAIRTLLGDYLAVRRPNAGDPQVFWLQLGKLEGGGSPYRISAWSHLAYGNQGDFQASYDPALRQLTGRSASLGEFRLSHDGARFAGTIRMDSKSPAEVAFDRVLRREVFEARAANPPARMRAGPASTIRLVYLAAAGCGQCRSWELDHLQGARLTGMPEFKDIEFITSRRAAAKERLRKSDLPPAIAHLYDRFEKDKAYAKLLEVVPSFMLLVDDHVRIWLPGTFLDSPVYPVLRAAVREKTRPGS
jgi:hypothetical protein